MSAVYEGLIDASQQRYRGLRRLTQFYHRFAGNVIRIQQDRDCVLTEMSAGTGPLRLTFEERDEDGFAITITPFKNDLVFVSKVGFWAQVRFELFRFCLEAEALQKVNEMQMKTQFGGLFGGGRTQVARFKGTGPGIEQPGRMELRSAGSRVYVATELVMDLGSYELEGGAFDRPRIASDLEAVSYGLDKCLGAVTGG